MARQVLVYLDSKNAMIIVRPSMGFGHALRCHLRDEKMDADVIKFLEPTLSSRILGSQSVPNAILDQMTQQIAIAAKKRNVSPQIVQLLEERVFGWSSVLAGAERIKSTPLSYAYSLLLHRTAYVFCFMLPFGLADSIGPWAPLLAGIIAYTFFRLDPLGDELSVPFSSAENGLPLSAIARTIEINLTEQLGETNLPEPLIPRDLILL